MSGASTPRSRSRAKRSTTNLANLRLNPLSSKFVEPNTTRTPPKSPYGEPTTPNYSRQHSSYLQGKSAPSTPGILTRSSSKKRLAGGLSRRDRYDDDEVQDDFNYSYSASRPSTSNRADFGSGQITKAKSDAYLLQQQQQQARLSGHGVPISHRHKSSLHRINTASARDVDRSDESWLTHTSATASALLQESKGQSWLASREASTGHNVAESEDDDDDQYEEMAALNASTANLDLQAGEVHSPTSTRISRWGSRYGSRQGSRKTSRMTSPSGHRTPRARAADVPGYFDEHLSGTFAQPLEEQPAFVQRVEKTEEDEDNKEVERLTLEQSFGLGSMVDRFMSINLFKGDDQGDTTEEEDAPRNESAGEARERMAAEAKRKREEKERLVAVPPAPQGDGPDGKGDAYGWSDAAWFLSVASKALF